MKIKALALSLLCGRARSVLCARRQRARPRPRGGPVDDGDDLDDRFHHDPRPSAPAAGTGAGPGPGRAEGLPSRRVRAQRDLRCRRLRRELVLDGGCPCEPLRAGVRRLPDGHDRRQDADPAGREAGIARRPAGRRPAERAGQSLSHPCGRHGAVAPRRACAGTPAKGAPTTPTTDTTTTDTTTTATDDDHVVSREKPGLRALSSAGDRAFATVSRLAQRVTRRTLAAGVTPPLSWGVAPTSGHAHFCTPFPAPPPHLIASKGGCSSWPRRSQRLARASRSPVSSTFSTSPT